jgi:hypothetical protein
MGVLHRRLLMLTPLTPAGQALLDELLTFEDDNSRSLPFTVTAEALPAIERQAADRALADVEAELRAARTVVAAARHVAESAWPVANMDALRAALLEVPG